MIIIQLVVSSLQIWMLWSEINMKNVIIIVVEEEGEYLRFLNGFLLGLENFAILKVTLEAQHCFQLPIMLF